MANLKLDIAFWDYDRTRALAEGTVKIDGVDGSFHSAPIVTEIFRGMIADRRFDVSELGLHTFCVPLRMGRLHSLRSPCSRIALSGIPRSLSTRPAAYDNRKI